MHIVIIGGGAAGLFAAINAARRCKENEYTVLEATQKPLTKVLISGGGRCNVTHHCFDPKLLAKNYPRGSKELIGPFHRFGPQEVCDWFEAEGVVLKAEPDGRMFPVSNTSKTIANCLLDALHRAGGTLRKGARVASLARSGSTGFRVTLHTDEVIEADKVMLCTGSSPLGYQLAESLGHSIEKTVPSLFTFKVKDDFLVDLAGQSIPDARLELRFAEEVSRRVWRQSGPLLVTHWGFSGPAVLKLSAFAARFLHEAGYQAKLRINWVGGKTSNEVLEQLRVAQQSDARTQAGKIPSFGLSKRLWHRFLGDNASKNWADLSKKVLIELSEKLCRHDVIIDGKGVFKEEFVTCGGVKRSDIDFSRMESRLVPGLFFSGEVIDIDGITGGFNFQNAWTGSWIASQFL